MKKQIFAVCKLLLLSFFICSVLLIIEIDKRRIVKNDAVELSLEKESFDHYIRMSDYVDRKVSFVQNNPTGYDTDVCDSISKVAKIENYYIGYLEGGEESKADNRCNHYFYIKDYHSDKYLKEGKKIVYGLSAEDIKSILRKEINYNGEIEYENPVNYIYEKGEGGIIKGDFKALIKFFGILMILLTFIFSIFTVLLNKSEKIKGLHKLLPTYFRENSKKIRRYFWTYMIFYILIFLLFVKCVGNKSYVEQMSMTLNKGYFMQIIGDPDRPKGVGLEQKTEEVPVEICGKISKMAKEGSYYIGYLKKVGDDEEDIRKKDETDKRCDSYFYINSAYGKDVKFSLTEKDIKEKFTKELNYREPEYYLNKYGSGGHQEEELEGVMSDFIISAVFVFIIMSGILFKDYIKSRKKKKGSR